MSQPSVTLADFETVDSLAKPNGPQVTDASAADLMRDSVYSKFRIAVLNAVPHEYAAILAVLGNQHPIPSRDHANSNINYVKLTHKNGTPILVVLAGISGQGIAQAAAAASLVKFKCRNIAKIILVGIAAGQPNLSDKERDVRLGDIVVGSNVIQYDHVKRIDGRTEMRGDKLPLADADLVAGVHELRAFLEFADDSGPARPWERFIAENVPKVRRASRPDLAQDKNHSRRVYVAGLEYDRPEHSPYIHFGTIASAGTLLKDAHFRDELNAKYGTLAYEMEGAGVAIAAATGGFGYLIVRGICDYGDSDKNDTWQTYASVCAASFARALIETA